MTLIEVLITVSILSAGAIFVLQALGRGAEALARAKTQMVVYQFARAKMADVEMAIRQGAEPAPRGRFHAGGQEFRWSIAAQPLDEPQLELVTLTVDWDLGRYSYESHFSAVGRIPLEELEEEAL